MALVRAGIRGFRLHARDVTGSPDFVFDSIRLAVFVDGCFWHGCPRCGHRPKSNRKYWNAKLDRNISRDRRTRSKLRRQGWSVIRVWAHDLSVPAKALAKVASAIASRRVGH